MREISFLPSLIEKLSKGEKTETRRLKRLDFVNEKPKLFLFSHFDKTLDPTERAIAVFKDKRTHNLVRIACPYGKAGDTLLITDTELKIKVTDISIDRLWDISRAGAIAEGFESIAGFLVFFETITSREIVEKNPFVWIIKFHLL